jgi:hypothetical protein
MRKTSLCTEPEGYMLDGRSLKKFSAPRKPRGMQMATRVLCFGMHDCNRSLVLLQVGYDVNRCATLIEFRDFITQRPDVHAVLIAGGPTDDRRQVVALTREHSHACLVLFDNSYDRPDEGEFDLIVSPLSPTKNWLRQVADLIERSRSFEETI